MTLGLEIAIYAALIAFIINISLSPFLIPALKRLKIGQHVRDDGPSSHISKNGTPTMGGIIILISLVFASLFFIRGSTDALILIFVTTGFGLIGFWDDYTKVVKKRSLGLNAIQKILLQLLVSGIFIIYLYMQQSTIFDINFSSVLVPFVESYHIDLGVLYLPLVVLVMVGTVNGVNLTDGLDGLAAGVTLLVCVFFVFISNSADSGTLPVVGAASGSLLAFLLFNAHPAKIFMGDTGSLALGGLIAALSIILKVPLLLPIVGLIYVLESLSVIIQVLYFKKTGKRFFKMAPIHHSFEVSGWPETKVVTLFYVVTAVACLVGLLAARHIF